MNKGFAAWVLALILMTGACETEPDPQPPTACAPFPNLTLTKGDEARVVACFQDENLATLIYEVTSSVPSVVSVSITELTITLEAIDVGEATILIVVRNEDGLAANTEFLATVANRPPEPCEDFTTLYEVFVYDTVSTTVCFEDPDGKRIEIEGSVSDPRLASVRTHLSNDGRIADVDIIGKGVGRVDLTIEAKDPDRGVGTVTATVEIPNRAPRICHGLPDEIFSYIDDSSGHYVCTEDPDGQSLVDSVSAGDFVSTSLSADGDTIYLTAVSPGEGLLRYWSTDPYGESISVTSRLFMVEGGIVIDDDFSSNSGKWKATEAVSDFDDETIGEGMFVIEDGLLKTYYARTNEAFGGAEQAVDVTHWTLEARARIIDPYDQALLALSVEGPLGRTYWLLLEENFSRGVYRGGLFIIEKGEGGWRYWDYVHDGPGFITSVPNESWLDLTITMQGSVARIYVNNVKVYEFTEEHMLIPRIWKVALLAVDDEEDGMVVEWDHVRLLGTSN